LTIATPCYNESESLPIYFERIQHVRTRLERLQWQTELILIDDGSRDNTPLLLDHFAHVHPHTVVVRHPRNLGYGATIKTAFAMAKTEWVVFVDADSNYDQRLTRNLL